MKVSFDFDGTLSELHVQKYARELIERGIEVWVVTSRFENAEKYKEFFGTFTLDYDHNDLWEVVNDLGIQLENIHFTNMQPKSEFLKDRGFIWHLDDDYIENREIPKLVKIPSINVKKNYKHKCERHLNKSRQSL
jgi:hypothetical protein